MSKVIDLYEFLLEAELHQYYSELKNDLKVSYENFYLTAVPITNAYTNGCTSYEFR